MAKYGEETKSRIKKIIELLPDDPAVATTEILTAAAVVAVSAGFDDDAAVRGLRAAMVSCRAAGVGEEHH